VKATLIVRLTAESRTTSDIRLPRHHAFAMGHPTVRNFLATKSGVCDDQIFRRGFCNRSGAMDVKVEIAKALERRPRKLPLRASFDSIDVAVFADNKQLQKIDNSNWQIIFGRRGSGKTTLLGAYSNYITKAVAKNRHATIELVANDFISVIADREKGRLSDIEYAQVYFADFMRKIAKYLFDVFSTENARSKFYNRFTNSRKKKYIEELVSEIHSSTVESVPVVFSGSRETKTTSKKIEEQSGSSSRSFELSANASADGTLPGVSAKGGFGVNGSESDKSETETVDIKSLDNYKFNYAKTRDLIRELLEALDLDKLFIVLDEWSELDRSASTNVQPYFAELLKRVFWNQDRFVLKIGAIRNQTKTFLNDAANARIGLELGADIFELSLDNLYSNPNELNMIAFYEELLFKHLRYCNPELAVFDDKTDRDFYGSPEVKPIDTFVSYIFKSRKELATLVRGAGGLPRDFIEMFDTIARNKDFGIKEAWGMGDVQNCVREHFIKTKQKNIGVDSSKNRLLEKIVGKIRETGGRLIVVPRSASKEFLDLIAEFYHSRMIHEVSYLDVPTLLRGKYDLYYADLGLMLDVHKHRIGEHYDAPEAFPLDGHETDDDVSKYVLTEWTTAVIS
jgi:hypothetical protein